MEEMKDQITVELDKKWVIKISREGFQFNKEEYPNASADDFARAFMNVLEQNFDVYFLPKNPSLQDIKGCIMNLLARSDKEAVNDPK